MLKERLMTETTELQEKIERVRDVFKIQGENGNWNCNQYMHGLYNGLALALSILEDKEPEYRAAPKEWLDDRKPVDGLPIEGAQPIPAENTDTKS